MLTLFPSMIIRTRSPLLRSTRQKGVRILFSTVLLPFSPKTLDGDVATWERQHGAGSVGNQVISVSTNSFPSVPSASDHQKFRPCLGRHPGYGVYHGSRFDYGFDDRHIDPLKEAF